jgi:hypothetical protein
MKPVAWIDPFDLERLPLYDCWVSGEKTKKVDIPLYTHPVKELTDEEIKEVWMDKKSNITMIGGIYPKKLEEYLNSLEARIKELEAILRKAQEK